MQYCPSIKVCMRVLVCIDLETARQQHELWVEHAWLAPNGLGISGGAPIDPYWC